MKQTTLGELKNLLPIGIKGREDRAFTFKSWGLDEEKQIAEMKKKESAMGPFVNKLMAHMIESLSGEDFKSKAEGEKLLIINQMSLMDVLYMYVYLRFDQLDENIRMNITCPSCGKLNKDFTADLRGLDVGCVGHDDPEHTIYKLRKPFDLGAEKIETLKLKRTPWDAMRQAQDEVTTNSGKMMELIFKHSISGFNDSEGFVDIDEILGKIRKVDLERLSNAITEHNAGPKINVSDKCKYCGSIFFMPINWSYDDFFGSSSLPLN